MVRSATAAPPSRPPATTPRGDGPGDKTIPIRTPFALTGQATDPDGDPLVHIWEQNDRGGAAGTALGNQTKIDGPLFRIFGELRPRDPGRRAADQLARREPRHVNPTRVFPDMDQILANNTNADDRDLPGHAGSRRPVARPTCRSR